jgi:hypothetical protein
VQRQLQWEILLESGTLEKNGGRCMELASFGACQIKMLNLFVLLPELVTEWCVNEIV